jgi:hypothetical protein
MKNITKNWKTSLVGGGALATGLMQLIQTGDFKAALPTLLMGLIGLLAKDGGVTGV